MKEMPPPTHLESEWLSSVRIRLIKDLRPVIQALPRTLPPRETMIEPELCMSGEAEPKSEVVSMRPTVWIRCGSKKCRKAVQKAVNDLHYLHTFSRGPVRVCLRAPRPAGDSPDRFGFNRTAGATDRAALDLQLQQGPDARGCSRRLRISRPADSVASFWTSTVGGLIKVDGVLYGLTTAHSIFEALQSRAADHSRDSIGTDSDTDSGFSSLDVEDYAENDVVSPEIRLGKHPVEENEDFEAIKVTLELASYAGRELHDEHDQLEGGSVDSDFALIQWPDSFLPRYNWYPSATGHTVISSIDEDPGPGEVTILDSLGKTAVGDLLPGNAVLMQRDALFNTRKIQTHSCLRK
jgi:hypothetical protein